MIHRISVWIAKLHGNQKKITEVVAEWHSFIQGFCESMCPWRPRHKLTNKDLKKEIHDEHHYYVAGRVIGFITLIFLAVGVILIIIGAVR